MRASRGIQGRPYHLLPTVVAAIAVSLQSSAASGDEAPATAVPADDRIQEVVVTARRREESQQTVPVAVSAFDSAQLQSRSIKTIADLNGTAPNLAIQSGPAGDASVGNFIIRGIGQFDFLPTYDTGTGLYVDGVYVSGISGSVLDLAGIDRVEVLRGPQGTLFGRNSIGGAVNITTKTPDGHLGGELEATTGSRSRADVRGALEFPIVADKAAASITLIRRKQEGYGHRLLTGQDQGNTNMWAGRMVLNLTPTDTFSLRLTADKTERAEHAAVSTITTLTPNNPSFGALVGFGYAQPNPAGGFTSPYVVPEGSYNNYATGPNRSDVNVWGLSGTAEWKPGPVTLKSITGYRKTRTDSGTDNDDSPLPIIEQTNTIEIRQFTEELQILGSLPSFDWLAGVFYFDSDSSLGQRFGAFGIPATGPLPAWLFANTLKSRSYAGFASGTYAFTDQLKLTVGGRYSYDSKRIDLLPDFYIFGVSAYTDPNGVPLPLGTSRQGRKNWNDFSPKASLEYRLTPDAFVYASVSRGYKAGSFNGRSSGSPGTGLIFTQPESYDPERATSYELGTKLDLLDRRLRVNAAVFQSNVSNSQQLAGQTLGGTPPQIVVTVTNIGNARIRGAESEITAIPLKGLTLTASAGYLDPQFTSINRNVFDITKATQFYGSSKWTLALGSEYRFELGSRGSLRFRADANYRSLYYYQIPNVGSSAHEGEAQPAYTLLNLRATYESPNDRFSVSAFGTNVTNRYYSTFRSNFFGALNNFVAPPAEWGLSASVKF